MSKQRASSAQNLDAQLCFALYRASRAMTRAYAPLLEPLGLTYPQYLAMLALWRQDGVSVRQLGDLLELDSATLTPLLKRLEAQGLVTRQRSTTDERVVEIHLSEAGRALGVSARSIPGAVARRAGFDPRDAGSLAQLARLKGELDALAAALEDEG